jgi:hypothetical protein
VSGEATGQLERRIGIELERAGLAGELAVAVLAAIDAAGLELCDRATGRPAAVSAELAGVRFRVRGMPGVAGLSVDLGGGSIVQLERRGPRGELERFAPVFVPAGCSRAISDD